MRFSLDRFQCISVFLFFYIYVSCSVITLGWFVLLLHFNDGPIWPIKYLLVNKTKRYLFYFDSTAGSMLSTEKQIFRNFAPCVLIKGKNVPYCWASNIVFSLPLSIYGTEMFVVIRQTVFYLPLSVYGPEMFVVIPQTCLFHLPLRSDWKNIFLLPKFWAKMGHESFNMIPHSQY